MLIDNTFVLPCMQELRKNILIEPENEGSIINSKKNLIKMV